MENERKRGYMLSLFMLFMILVIGTLAMIIREKNSKIEKLEEDLSYYENTILWKTGFSLGFGDYHLESFDGGLRWYAISKDSTGTLIEGSADSVFPGLLQHLNAWDKLTEYVEKNGPISIDDNLSNYPEKMKLLEKAGFVITRKDTAAVNN